MTRVMSPPPPATRSCLMEAKPGKLGRRELGPNLDSCMHATRTFLRSRKSLSSAAELPRPLQFHEIIREGGGGGTWRGPGLGWTHPMTSRRRISERESLATLKKTGLENRQKGSSDALPAGRRPTKNTLMMGVVAPILYTHRGDNPFHRGRVTRCHQPRRPG